MKEYLGRLENDHLEFRVDIEEGQYTYFLYDKLNGAPMADMDYFHEITLWGGKKYRELSRREVTQQEGRVTIRGTFAGCAVSFEQVFEIRAGDRWLHDTLTLKNEGTRKLVLADLDFGMRKMLFRQFEGWCEHLDEYKVLSLPTRRYRSQLIDHLLTEYTAQDLLYAPWKDPEKPADEGGLKPGYLDEGWIWAGAAGGLIVCKYNQKQIEYTRLHRQGFQLPGRGAEDVGVIYGGVSIFDGNPELGLSYEPGASYTFGAAKYTTFQGGFEDGYYAYRDHLDANGHVFPEDYDPPVHWNELYNLGWHGENFGEGHFSDDTGVQAYSLEQLYGEARVAKDAGAESLYLDPTWDLYPGSSVWDEKRLGKFKDFCDKMHHEFGLKVALHLMMTFTSDDEIPDFYCKNLEGKAEQASLDLYRVCTNETWIREKTARLLKLVDDGVDFFMFDFPDYGDLDFVGCQDPNHGHEVPMMLHTHSYAILRVIQNVHERNPKVLIEAHDRHNGGMTDYHALYYQHGLPNSFDENWGYEYMWNPHSDLISGKALSLYEYNLAYSIPLYLHINEHSDNLNLISLWWYISTCRHLGIGGVSREDPKYPILQSAMALYHSMKAYFTRGIFRGVDYDAHLHVGKQDGTAVLTAYNFTSNTVQRTIEIDCEKHGVSASGAAACNGKGESIPCAFDKAGAKISVVLEMEPLSAAVVKLQ